MENIDRNSLQHVNSPNNKKRLLFWVIIAMSVGLVVLFAIIYMSRNGSGLQQTTPPENEEESVVIVYPDDYEQDKDRDGILDEEEAKLNLSSETFDTDGDGISDKDEMDVWETDPTNADSDGDGVGDGEELIDGTDPLTKQ